MCQESCEGETRNHACCRTSPETVHCTAVDPPSLHSQTHEAYHIWRETAAYQNIGQSRVRWIANGSPHRRSILYNQCHSATLACEGKQARDVETRQDSFL
ncbi:hypothetical protein JAAARDRAFT_257040 [Jaapia argillacea MUCL 33604]|uniref:Uncharacterized protein n=1 Tax=Jaapia argillacea MUCL 33604 TaxID=933084 RepID=A0A067PTH0_9AGAM|nr:hypothetical protein JAAARDRAFT_257040 [Jaapia argillacea MUCL 33604]